MTAREKVSVSAAWPARSTASEDRPDDADEADGVNESTVSPSPVRATTLEAFAPHGMKATAMKPMK